MPDRRNVRFITDGIGNHSPRLFVRRSKSDHFGGCEVELERTKLAPLFWLRAALSLTSGFIIRKHINISVKIYKVIYEMRTLINVLARI